VEEMESVQKVLLKSNKYKSKNYKNSSHKDRMFEILQSSRDKYDSVFLTSYCLLNNFYNNIFLFFNIRNDSFCDIKLQTDDGTIIYGHKNILASATPYFKAMFSSFGEINKDLLNITKLDSTILKLLIDYIYTGEIMITQENVQV